MIGHVKQRLTRLHTGFSGLSSVLPEYAFPTTARPARSSPAAGAAAAFSHSGRSAPCFSESKCWPLRWARVGDVRMRYTETETVLSAAAGPSWLPPKPATEKNRNLGTQVSAFSATTRRVEASAPLPGYPVRKGSLQSLCPCCAPDSAPRFPLFK